MSATLHYEWTESLKRANVSETELDSSADVCNITWLRESIVRALHVPRAIEIIWDTWHDSMRYLSRNDRMRVRCYGNPMKTFVVFELASHGGEEWPSLGLQHILGSERMVALRVQIQCTCPNGSIFVSSHLDKESERKKQTFSEESTIYLWLYRNIHPLWSCST